MHGIAALSTRGRVQSTLAYLLHRLSRTAAAASLRQRDQGLQLRKESMSAPVLARSFLT